MKLILNEIKKTILSKKYIIAMLILAIIYGFMCYGTYSNSIKRTPENQLQRNTTYIDQLKKDRDSKNISDERKKQLDLKIKDLESFNDSLNFQILNKNLGWAEALEKTNSILKDKLEDAKKKEDFNQIQFCIKSIENNEYCLKNNIKPSSDYDITAVSMLSRTNMFAAVVIFSIIIAIITSDSISGEFNPATIKLLLTKPISRQKILFSKFAAAIITCTLSFLLIKSITFLIIGISFKFGDFRSPVTFYSKYTHDKDAVIIAGYGVKPILESLTIYSTFEVILLNELITLLYISSCTAVCFLISVISRKSAISMAVSMALFTLTSILSLVNLMGNADSNIKFIHTLNLFLFSTYASGELVINRFITERLGESFVTIPFVMIVLLTWTIVCYLISNFIFVKKDILA